MRGAKPYILPLRDDVSRSSCREVRWQQLAVYSKNLSRSGIDDEGRLKRSSTWFHDARDPSECFIGKRSVTMCLRINRGEEGLLIDEIRSVGYENSVYHG